MPDAGIQEGRFFTSDLSASNNTKVQIYGQYTTAAGLGQDAVAPGLDQSKTLLILLHGLTYDHDYWDMPEIGSQYSFVEAAKNDGYDTLAIDRLGEGQSSKPSADLVNVDNQAYITDQIIQQIRAGGLGTNYDKIILVGHSYGSVLSIKTAGTYNDVDGVVLTGLAHGTSSPDSTGLFVPASTDPNLPPEQQQPGYLTSADGKRGFFYNTADADPLVIAHDEATKQTVTTAEIAGINPTVYNAELTNNIKAPILTVLGSADKLFVQPDYVAEATDEHKWYAGSSSHQTLVVPGAGHDLQLEYASQYYSKEIFDWIDRTAGNPHGGSVISAGGGDDVQAGDDKANTLIDGPGNDILIGNGGDDTFTTGSGTNIIDGGSGIDKAVFGFNFNDATFDFHSNAVTISSGDSINTLKGVEQFQFADRTIDNNDNSPLVDDLFYLAHNKDVFAAGQDADTHYANFGFKEGRDPNAFFSTKGYLATNPDVAKSGGNPLVDYDQNGWKQGHDPSANFDNELYLARNPDVKAASIDPLAHFLSDGQAEGRQAYAAIGKATDIGAAHGFDAEYYLLSNPDVAQAALAAGGDTFAFAQQHFNQLGWHEGRNPNAVFDTKGYLAAYEDVAANGINPLTHYDTFGWKEGRDPSADFDTKTYEATYADVKAQGLDPLVHYLQFGAVENRSTFGDGHFS